MNVLVTGSTGMVGSALCSYLVAKGHTVTRVIRPGSSVTGKTVSWNPDAGQIDVPALEGHDAAVHLAGESIAAGRWNAEKKARIKDSRTKSTRLLGEALAKLQRPPRTLVSASAVGYYGSRGDEVLTEQSSSGAGFLAEVCREWEAATQPALDKGIRVVLLRFGAILSKKGGALARMLLPFRMGVGGRIGDGRQYMSWIALDDAVGAIHHALATEALRGPTNAVAPQPVTNLEFTKTLGRTLGRPTIFPMPAFAARLAFGELADELLLSSQRVQPARLLDCKYSFRFPDLATALQHIINAE